MAADRPALGRSDLALPAPELAERLIGVGLTVDGVGGIIVETEAYTREDPASHSFRGPGRANRSMFAEPGTAYVYRSYGRHWCFNIVGENHGAVLIRSLEPCFGLELMAARRRNATELCRGPGRLAQALAIDGTHDGLDATSPPFRLVARALTPPMLRGVRIGISRARDVPWRFGLAGSRYLSRPF